MNSFAHALPHLDDPYVAVGCCIPDWLTAADRKCRVREKKATPFCDHTDPIVSSVANGIVNHHRDDAWFHNTPSFHELSLKYAVQIRELYGNERTMRTGFVGHVVIELFLDAFLHQNFPGQLERYYQQVASVDAEQVQAAINLFATKQTNELVPEIERGLRMRYLFDYSTDEGTVMRINKVLARIGLDTLDEQILPWMKATRSEVYDRANDLLSDYKLELPRATK
jgi:hypothetical protein